MGWGGGAGRVAPATTLTPASTVKLRPVLECAAVKGPAAAPLLWKCARNRDRNGGRTRGGVRGDRRRGKTPTALKSGRNQGAKLSAVVGRLSGDRAW